MKSRWNEAEDSFLKEFYPELGVLYCSIFLYKTKISVIKRACKLGVKSPCRKNIITKEILLGFINRGMNREEIAKYTNKCVGRIDQLAKLFKLKICKNNWSIEEERFLIENYPIHGGKYCANKLRKSLKSIYKKRDRLKLYVNYQEFFKNHPESPCLGWVGGGISIPCDKLKKDLLDLNIVYEEEKMPLLHLNKRYRADILMRDIKLIIEVNGSQHYLEGKQKFILDGYYQKRHDLLVENGWRVFEIPCHFVFKKAFLTELFRQINANYQEFDVEKCKILK